MKLSVQNSQLMTGSDMALAFARDAEDTLENLYTALRALTLGCSGVGEVVDLTGLSDLSYILPDGDVHTIRKVESGNFLSLLLDEEYTLVTCNQANQVISASYDPDGDSAIDKVVNNSLAGITSCINTQDIVQRLSNLAATGEANLTNVVAVLSPLQGQVDSESQQLINMITSLGTNLNSASVLALLGNMGKTLTGMTGSESSMTVEFGTSDYYVKTYAPSVIKTVVSQGAQIVGTILLYAGTGIGKIIGGLALAAGWIVSGINSATQSLGTAATYNPLASTNHFAQPIIQTTIPASTWRSLEPSFTTLINETYIVKFTLPGAEFYCWLKDPQNVTSSDLNCEGYLALNVQDQLPQIAVTHTSSGTVYNNLPYKVVSDTTGAALYINKLSSIRRTNWGNASDVDYPVAYLQNTTVFGSATRMQYTDAELLQLVSNALRAASLLLVPYTSLTSERYGALPTQYPVAFISNTSSGWVPLMSDFSTPSNVEIAEDNVYRFDYYMRNYSSFRTLFASNGNNWALLVNTLIPSLRVCLANDFGTLLRWMISGAMASPSSTYIYDNDVNYTATAAMANLYDRVVAKDDPMVSPPNYSRQAVWVSIAIGVGCVLLAASAVLVARTAIRRALAKRMTGRYSAVETAREAYRNNPTDLNLDNYCRQVRRYNMLARVTGYSTISSVSGWETGDIGMISNTSAVTSRAISSVATGIQTVGSSVADISDSLTGIGSNVSDAKAASLSAATSAANAATDSSYVRGKTDKILGSITGN